MGTTEFKKDERHTHYYLWVPFIPVLCLAVTKAPRVFWKQVCERGMIAGAVGGTDGQPADKIAERFGKLRRGAKRFHLSFFLCELLNIASVIICFTMLDTSLGGNLLDYDPNLLSTVAVRTQRQSTPSVTFSPPWSLAMCG